MRRGVDVAKTLGCPKCFGVGLEPRGRPSFIDGQTGWRCAGCGLALWPRRSRLRLAGAFLLALFITLFLYYMLYVAVIKGRVTVGNGGGRGVGVGDVLLLLSGFVVGPAGLVLIGRALFGRMAIWIGDRDVAQTGWSEHCTICGAGLSAAKERRGQALPELSDPIRGPMTGHPIGSEAKSGEASSAPLAGGVASGELATAAGRAAVHSFSRPPGGGVIADERTNCDHSHCWQLPALR
jgi:hypothetical protein